MSNVLEVRVVKYGPHG